MKTLQESLFDKDLAKKDIGVLGVITNCLENYISEHHTRYYEWVKCLVNIKKSINYPEPAQWSLEMDGLEKMDTDELYISIFDSSRYGANMILCGYGLTGEYRGSNVPPIITISYSPGINDIYADVYNTKTVDYKDILNDHKFNWYKLNKDDVKSFVNNVFNKLEQVW